MEEHFQELRDIKKNQKYAQALPLLSIGDRESQIRKQISETDKIIRSWDTEFYSENLSASHVFLLGEDGQTVELYETSKKVLRTKRH